MRPRTRLAACLRVPCQREFRNHYIFILRITEMKAKLPGNRLHRDILRNDVAARSSVRLPDGWAACPPQHRPSGSLATYTALDRDGWPAWASPAQRDPPDAESLSHPEQQFCLRRQAAD